MTHAHQSLLGLHQLSSVWISTHLLYSLLKHVKRDSAGRVLHHVLLGSTRRNLNGSGVLSYPFSVSTFVRVWSFVQVWRRLLLLVVVVFPVLLQGVPASWSRPQVATTCS